MDHGRNDDGKRRNGRRRGSGSRNDDTVKVIERREKKKREGGYGRPEIRTVSSSNRMVQSTIPPLVVLLRWA
jgi:hypothetical protein